MGICCSKMRQKHWFYSPPTLLSWMKIAWMINTEDVTVNLTYLEYHFLPVLHINTLMFYPYESIHTDSVRVIVKKFQSFWQTGMSFYHAQKSTSLCKRKSEQFMKWILFSRTYLFASTVYVSNGMILTDRLYHIQYAISQGRSDIFITEYEVISVKSLFPNAIEELLSSLFFASLDITETSAAKCPRRSIELPLGRDYEW